MLKSELLEIIANGESSGLEFKRDDVRPEQVAKEIVAMANFQGGRMLLGVEDDGTISGLSRSNTEEWLMNIIHDKIHPIILPYYEQVKIDESTYVAVITFPPGVSKPYVVCHNGREEIYIRVGTTSQPATREQQMRLFEMGGLLHSELLPVPGTHINCLDFERIRNYLVDIMQDPEVPETPDEWNSRLLGMGFLTESGGVVYCTIAGLVLFGKTPRRYLKQHGLRLLAFPGKEKQYEALMDQILDRPLVGRREIQDRNKHILVDPGIVDAFISAADPFVSKESSDIGNDYRRKKKMFYPMDAIRETVVNALAHRDWTRSVDIEVGLYADRMEVISPGALPNSMTIEKMVAGQRSPRNPLIVEVLRDYGYVDNRGMGVRTKIIPLMKRINHVDPIFEATEDYLKTTLYKHPKNR